MSKNQYTSLVAIHQNIFKMPIFCILTCFLSACSLIASEKVTPESNIKELFSTRYEKWMEWKRSPEFGFCSDKNGTTGVFWESMVDLGPEALPYIAEKVKSDPILYLLFGNIVRIIHRDGRGDPPTNYEDAMKKERDRYLSWWNEDRKHIDTNIRKDLRVYKEMKAAKKSQKELDDAIAHIRENYGVFSLPYILPEIENGDNAFVPMMWELLDNVEGNKDKKEEFMLKLNLVVIDPKERVKIIHDVTTRNKDRVDTIKNLIQEYKDEKSSENGDKESNK